MANGYKICIPARLESSRLEQKLLCKVNGKTIIQRTWERCLESSADTVTVITDSTEIFDLISDLGGDCFLSQSVHESGTDRLAEYTKYQNLPEDLILINVQGDEPLIDINSVNKLADFVHSNGSNYATICKPFKSSEDEADVNKVKVHIDSENMAVSFFRKATDDMTNTFHHIGVYAYSVGFLNTFSSLPQSPNEEALKLEQMRGLDNNHNIHVLVVEDHTSIGIDTPEDLEKFKILIEQIENN